MLLHLILRNIIFSGNASLESWGKDWICSARYFYFKYLFLSSLSLSLLFNETHPKLLVSKN